MSKLEGAGEAALAALGIAAAALPSTFSLVGVAQTAIEMHSTIKNTRRALSWWWKRRRIVKRIPLYIDNWEEMNGRDKKALRKGLRAVFALDEEFARTVLDTKDVDQALFKWFQSVGANEDMAKALRDIVQDEMHHLLLNNPELLDHLQYQGILALNQAVASLGGDVTLVLSMLERIRGLLVAQLIDQIMHRENLRQIVGLNTFREIVKNDPNKEAEPFRDGPPTMADFAAGFVVAPKKMLKKVAKALGLGVPTLRIKGPVIPDESFAAASLFGHSGSGKTCLALTLAYELEQFGWDIFCLDLATFERPADQYVFVQRVADVVRERYLDVRTDSIGDPPRVLLIIENIHLAPELARDFLFALKRVSENSQSGGLVRLLLVGRPPLETKMRGSLIEPLDAVIEQSNRIDMEPFSKVTVANMLAIVKRRQPSIRLGTKKLMGFSCGDNFLIVSALKAIDKDGSLDVLRDNTALASKVWNFYLQHLDPLVRENASAVLCIVAAFSSTEAPVLTSFVNYILQDRVPKVDSILTKFTTEGLLRMFESQDDCSRVFIQFHHSRRAQMILDLCEDTNAWTLFVQYFAYNPQDSVQFAMALAQWGAHRGDEDLLINLFNLIKDRRDCVSVLWTIGVKLSETKPGVATEAFDRITKLREDYAEAWNNLGVLLAKQERWDRAERALRKATELREDFAEAWNNLGIVLTERKKWREAESAFRKAIRLRPDYAGKRFDLDFVLLE